MCKAIAPASFLAVSFKKRKTKTLSYSNLESIRQKMSAVTTENGEPYDVDWNHDSFQFAMGFYANVFKRAGDGIECNFQNLDVFYDSLISALPAEDVRKLIERI